MPRYRAPNSLKLARGTYRAGRDKGRDGLQAGGQPVKPESLTGDASRFWDDHVPELVRLGAVKKIDSPTLTCMCEWWSDLRAVATALAAVRPGTKRAIYLQAMKVSAQKQFNTLAFRFGLSPLDRVRIVGPANPNPPAALPMRNRKA
jgi:phage terminase small subunit